MVRRRPSLAVDASTAIPRSFASASPDGHTPECCLRWRLAVVSFMSGIISETMRQSSFCRGITGLADELPAQATASTLAGIPETGQGARRCSRP